MLSCSKVKHETRGSIRPNTAPVVLNQANMDIVTLSLFDYVTHGTSSDIGYDYAMLDEVELNFDD